ncbi:mycofactocin system transcriptional regulator [Gryllotalpicola kribbensis]|uniref:Mycofactocin system transcriptional regulator n=2 Tax=Gryllotalpicola kribbensis TaxID=993084 RepID=A0ABP8ATQ9_9MICO
MPPQELWSKMVTMTGQTGAHATRRATTVAQLSHIGLQLFIENGFDETTVDEIAAAAGIGRRTFFRYFASKNDLPWGDFDELVERMRADLAAVPDSEPLYATLTRAVLDFNTYPASELQYHRERMQLLMTVPSLVAHSTLRYESWREVIAEFAARRLGEPVGSLRPRMIGWVYLAASLGAYEQWLHDPGSELLEVLRSALDILSERLTA